MARTTRRRPTSGCDVSAARIRASIRGRWVHRAFECSGSSAASRRRARGIRILAAPGDVRSSTAMSSNDSSPVTRRSSASRSARESARSAERTTDSSRRFVVGLLHARLVTSHVPERVQRRRQRAPGERPANAALRNHEDEGVRRFRRPGVTPAAHQGHERVLGDVLRGPATAGPGERVCDQPRRERRGGRFEVHIR